MEVIERTPSPLTADRREFDACGVGFVANVSGVASHEIVLMGLQALENLEHRGACGCDPESGDGAGVLVQLPHEFLERQCGELGLRLPEPRRYGAGMVFLPPDPSYRTLAMRMLERAVGAAGLEVIGWREVPTDDRHCGRLSLSAKPAIAQIFVKPRQPLSEEELERRLFLARKIAEHESVATGGQVARHFYVCSLSCRTMVYKGMLMAPQVLGFFPDLRDPSFKSALALVHSRFSTNTLPT
ncbi:MAG: glutamate synthase subunit alpha, partial [Candidatus Dadabacteria bacterium]